MTSPLSQVAEQRCSPPKLERARAFKLRQRLRETTLSGSRFGQLFDLFIAGARLRDQLQGLFPVHPVSKNAESSIAWNLPMESISVSGFEQRSSWRYVNRRHSLTDICDAATSEIKGTENHAPMTGQRDRTLFIFARL